MCLIWNKFNLWPVIKLCFLFTCNTVHLILADPLNRVFVLLNIGC